MTDNVRLLWQHKTEKQTLGVAISLDGQFVVAASDDGFVYCLDRGGDLRWRYPTGIRTPFRVTLSDDARRIAIGSRSAGDLLLLDSGGQLLWRSSTTGYSWPGAAISADGEWVCAGSTRGLVIMWNGQGQELWRYETGGQQIRPLSMTPDGERIAFGADDGYVYLLDRRGRLIWRQHLGGPVWCGARQSAGGDLIVCGTSSTDDHQEIVLLDREGQIVVRLPVSGNVNAVAITPDGSAVAAGSNDNHVYRLDRFGALLWKYRTGHDVYGVALSADGQFVAAASSDHSVYLLDGNGEVLLRHQTGNEAYAVALSHSGRWLAAAGHDGIIYCFENLLASASFSGQDAIHQIGAMAIRDIRRGYILNPYLGFGRWFETFHRYLLSGHFDLCQQLLEEARGQRYPFTTQEWNYVDSREGVLRLCQGIFYQQQGDFALAENYYRRSLEIQQRAGNPKAQGDTRTALDLLAAEKETGVRDPALQNIAAEPIAGGGIESLLLGRLAYADAVERRQIIDAAFRLRKVEPLLRAMELEDEAGRVQAIVPLARLAGEKVTAALLAATRDDNWFVRWQAITALSQDSVVDPTFKESLAGALRDEHDPEVRRALARTIRDEGDRRATRALLAALTDSDADVQWEAATALGQVGDRRALAALNRVDSGKDYLGRDVAEAARKAAEQIAKRHSGPTAGALHACRLADEGRLILSATFQADENIYFLADVAGVDPQLQFRLICADDAGRPLFKREGGFVDLRDDALSLAARRRSSGARIGPVELIDDPPPAAPDQPSPAVGQEFRPTGQSILIRLAAPQPPWPHGAYVAILERYDFDVADYEELARSAFRVSDRPLGR